MNILEQVEEYIIYELIKGIHREPEDFYDGDISDRIEEYKYYNLVQNFDLRTLDKNEWDVDQDLVDEIKELIIDNGLKSMPKIVISEDNSIIDGIHRINALLQLGYTHIDLYVGSNQKLQLQKKKKIKQRFS